MQSTVELTIFEFISPLSLIEQLSTCNVHEKYLWYVSTAYKIQFPEKISDNIDANDIKKLRALVEQVE